MKVRGKKADMPLDKTVVIVAFGPAAPEELQTSNFGTVLKK